MADGDDVFDGIKLEALYAKTSPENLKAFIVNLNTPVSEWAVIQDCRKNKGFSAQPPGNPELDALLTHEAICQWDYDAFRLRDVSTGHPLYCMSNAVVNFYGLVEKLGIDATKFLKFITAIERCYNDCLYHCKTHAADVVHATHCLLQSQELYKELGEDELLSLILAAAFHDIGHPGVGNNYLVAEKNTLATQHYNTAVLEKFHVGVARYFLEDAELSIISHFSAERREAVISAIEQMVLVTDMAFHSSLLKRLEGHVENPSAPSDVRHSYPNILTLQTILHAADLSNLCKRWQIHVQWSHAILAEFYSQGDLERQEGLEVSAHCIRDIAAGRTRQKLFIVDFVVPLYELCMQAVPRTRGIIEKCLVQMKHNFGRWNELGY